MSKLNTEAIDELMKLINEIREVKSLMSEFGINYFSDRNIWKATDFNDETGILEWDRKVLEEMNGIKKGNWFLVSGCVTTGHEHTYKNDKKYFSAPKKLAEVQGDIVEEYLYSIIQSISLKHFNIEFENPYGLYNNCGWEQVMGIKATVKESALETKTKKLNTPLKDYKELLLTNGELNYKTDAGQNNKEIYEYSGYVEYLEELCKNYKIEFDKNKIDWEWCNYIQTKTYELEKKLEKEIGIQ